MPCIKNKAIIMKDTKLIAQLKTLISYNTITGIFTFKERPNAKGFNTRFAHKKAGRINDAGYEVISLLGKSYLSHRLAYAFMAGRFPTKNYVIDHKNHMRCDNRWANLRKCNRSENACSTFSKGRGRSYFKGVSFCKETGLWLSRLTKNGKIMFLGRYKHSLDAAIAYDGAANLYHGQFATLNFS